MLLVYFFVFLFGLIFGSFANVLIWRIPHGKTILGRSICPKCKKKIRWFDNIPILSFFILRGKCRNCKEKISLGYLLVEMSSGAIFLLNYYFLPFPYFVIFSLLTPLLISIFVIDVKNQIIPDSLVFAGIILIFFYYLFTDNAFLFGNILSGFTASSFLLLVHLLTKGKGMGLGDVKFAVLGGFFMGLTMLFYWLMLSFLTGATTGCILILVKKYGFKSRIAFGPFLVFSLFLTVYLGSYINAFFRFF